MNRSIDRSRDGLATRSDRVPRLSGSPISRDRSIISRDRSGVGGRSALSLDRSTRFGFDRRSGRSGVAGIDRSIAGAGRRSLHARPGWSNISRDRVSSLHSRWHNVLTRPGVWRDRHFRDRWHDRGISIRAHWWPRYRSHAHRWFSPRWWGHRFGRLGGWHYWPVFDRYDYGYWWGAPAWPTLSSWFVWGQPAIWEQPVYYDYGPGGNVVYENNTVYVYGEPVASAEEFAESAAVLATVPPPPSEEAVEEAEWMPLGTFALTAGGSDDAEPRRVIQLAVNRQGIIGGTLYDVETDEIMIVQGRVDEETQRVAFRVGESEEIVFETGLYNLTQDEAPVLMHFGTDWTENYVLVRLDYPEDQR